MKIISWNCNGALRKKFPPLASFDDDVGILAVYNSNTAEDK